MFSFYESTRTLNTPGQYYVRTDSFRHSELGNAWQ